VILALIGSNEVPDDQGLLESMFDMIPSLFFCLLQTLLIAKWAGNISDIMLVLHNHTFRWFRPIVFSSVALLVLLMVATMAVLIDQSRPSPLLSDSVWVQLVNVLSGIVYFANGVFFVSLGLLLRAKWQPATPQDVSACRRILAIATLFGGCCIARGAALMFFVDGSRKNVAYSKWGAPFVITVEWIALVTSLFGLTNLNGGGASQGSSEPMIGSSRGVGSRRVPLTLWSTGRGESLKPVDANGGPRSESIQQADQFDEALPPSAASLNIGDAGE
jgi:hypothetical protein